MARAIPVETVAVLTADCLVSRDFMRIRARNRETGVTVTQGFWSGLGAVSAQVKDAETGLAVSYDFTGVGSLIAVDPIPMVANMTVQTIGVTFSQLDRDVNDLVRLYDLSQAKIEIYRAEFDPASMMMIAPASCRFVGFVDRAPLETGAEGSEGGVRLSCISSAQELTKSNPDVRSDESQRLRDPDDAFFTDVTTVADLTIFWGRKGEQVPAADA